MVGTQCTETYWLTPLYAITFDAHNDKVESLLHDIKTLDIMLGFVPELIKEY